MPQLPSGTRNKPENTTVEGERKAKKQRVQKTKLFGRTHWVVKEDERGEEEAAHHQGAVLASIKEKLGTLLRHRATTQELIPALFSLWRQSLKGTEEGYGEGPGCAGQATHTAVHQLAGGTRLGLIFPELRLHPLTI
jgi:hypothetical protein